jgi:opacity protein-like surface antigen
VRQDYAGYQVGHDISILNVGGTGANIHFGVTAGALEARTKDITPSGSYLTSNIANPGVIFHTPGGSFNEESQVPFVGLYGALTKGNFAFDGQVRWDFYQNSLTDAANGLSGQRLDAAGFSVTGNAAYHIPLRNNWFVEPSIGALYSRVEIDPLSTAGILTLNNPPPNFPYARGTVTVDDIESILGRASVSVGTSFADGRVTWQPYFTASVFHEFRGDVRAQSVEAGTGNSGIEPGILTITSKGGVGTYGQFAAGTAAVLGNSGWLAYIRGDYRIGDNLEGWGVNAGLRYQFDPGTRQSIKDGPGPVINSYNWTGPYIGAYVGTQWGDQDWSFNRGAGPDGSSDFAGTILGGQAGYNLQVGRAVFGIEGDYGWSNARGGKGGTSCPNDPAVQAITPFPFYTCESEVNQLTSLTGRMGITWGRALFYAKGGLAAGEITASKTPNTASPTFFGVPFPVGGADRPFTTIQLQNAVSTSNWQVGWTVGGGMEFALTDRWSAKAEYMYYDLGADTFTTFGTDPGTKVDTRGSLVRIGINLHLNPVERELPLK